MKGRNELHLNASTMKEAAQMWLDAHFRDGRAPIVDSVSYQAGSGGSTYRLVLVEREEPEAEAK